MMLDNY